ncbi:hypothetical protein [Spirosoma sp. KNUC1025]|uniref:hypothetical protein n=1 Tax=Spirosoma sp. KNUC1025 TaxID=2894082 RepID=UPI00386F5EE9|nr:hypothetical protein LN737_11335 [Spirosoma sp. KNUC1025]
MKKVLIYLLLFATLLPTVSQWGTIACYQVNKDYIARVLCENRDKPQLHCDGQCYLAKKLKAQQDKQDKETSERVQNTPIVQLYCELGQLFEFSPHWTQLTGSALPAYQLPSYLTPSSGLLQPPQV